MKVLSLFVLLALLSGFADSASVNCLQSNAMVDSNSTAGIDKQNRQICVQDGVFKITKENGQIEFQDKIKLGPADGFSKAIVTENYSIMVNISAVPAADGNHGNILIMGGAPGAYKSYFLK